MKEYTLWKEKGEYPIDEEGVLYISPFWKKANQLKEERAAKKIYAADIFIILVVVSFFSLIYRGIF